MVVVCVVALGSWGWCAESWGKYSAWRVRRTATIPPADKSQPKLPGLDCCCVAFPTAGFLAPGGRDLRVTVDGREASFKVIDIARDGTLNVSEAI